MPMRIGSADAVEVAAISRRGVRATPVSPRSARRPLPPPIVRRPAPPASYEPIPVEPDSTEVSTASRIRVDVVIPAILFIAALALYVIRLGTPSHYIYDEVYHAYTAAQYAMANHDAYIWNTRPPQEGVAYEWTHPPLGKLLIAGSILFFGDDSFGWRFASALFGAAGIVVAFFLARALTGDRFVATLAAGLLMVDGLYFVESRTSVLDIFIVVFIMGAALAFHRAMTGSPDRAAWPLVATGALMGAAIATKWNGVYASALIGCVALYQLARLWQAAGRKRPTPEVMAGLRVYTIWVPIGLVVVPLTVYLLTYLPFFLTGHDFGQFRELQNQMYDYHTNLVATHAYASDWWTWPFAYRPVWYYGHNGAMIYANGNPLLFWAFLPAVAWTVYRWWGQRKTALAILLIGFLGQWLPWAASPRLAFIYHFLPSVPFGCIAVASCVAELWRRREKYLRYPAVTYVVVVVLVFAFFYPIYAGVPLTPDRLEWRYWFDSWR